MWCCCCCCISQTFLENGRDLEGTQYANPHNDPFFDPPEDQHIGRSIVSLDCLLYMMPMDEWTPIIDYKVCVRAGLAIGKLLLVQT